MDTITATDARLNFASTAALDALDDLGYLTGPTLELEIADLCWLYAGHITERATGARVAFTYRSVALRDNDKLTSNPRYNGFAEFTKGLIPGDVSRTFTDPLMMFHEGQLSIWQAA